MFEFKRFQRDSRGSAIENVALKAGVAVVLGVFVAEGLATMAQKGELPKITLEWPDSKMQQLARSAPPAQLPASGTIYRNIGIDGVTTSSIPRVYQGPGVVSPCGEDNK